MNDLLVCLVAYFKKYIYISSFKKILAEPHGMWDLTFPTRIEPAFPVLEGSILTNGLLGKSHKMLCC